MYERLDRLRADVERWKKRIEEDRMKLKQAEVKLQEAENSQILADVGALKLTPEQLAEFLKLATAGGTVTADEPVNEPDEEEQELLETEDYDDDETGYQN